MSVLTAEVAGVPRIVAARPAVQGRAAPGRSSPPCTWPARTRSTSWAACRRSAPWRSAPRRSSRCDMLVGPGNVYRRRGQAPALRPRRHRPLRRPDRNPGDRRRHRRRRDLRDRPARPGRARLQLARRAADQLAQSWPRRTMAEVERLLRDPAHRRDRAQSAGRDYGEVIVCDTTRRCWTVANDIASEHVQVMTDRDDWFLEQHAQLRRAVPRPAHQRGLWRQGDRHQPHPADEEGRRATRAACGSASSSRPAPTSGC